MQSKPFPSIKRYSLSRAARIAPAFWLNLLICNLLAISVFNLEFSWPKFLSSFFFVNSYHYSTFFPTEVNGPLWSIGLEVSCYLLLPIVLFIIFKVAKSKALAALGVVSTIVALQVINPLIIQVFMTDDDQKGWQFGIDGGAKQWLPYWNVASFFTQFLLGCLAALVIVMLRAKATKQSRLFDLGFVVASGAAIILVVTRLTPGVPDSFTQQPYVSPFFALMMGVALVCASHSVYIARLLDNRLFSWLAKLSFGIYLWHVVVIEIIARKFVPEYVYGGVTDTTQWVLLSATVLVVSGAVAAASWKWLEAPILKAARTARINRD